MRDKLTNIIKFVLYVCGMFLVFGALDNGTHNGDLVASDYVCVVVGFALVAASNSRRQQGV